MNFVNYSKYGKKLNAMTVEELTQEYRATSKRMCELDNLIYAPNCPTPMKFVDERYKLAIYRNTVQVFLDKKKNVRKTYLNEKFLIGDIPVQKKSGRKPGRPKKVVQNVE